MLAGLLFFSSQIFGQAANIDQVRNSNTYSTNTSDPLWVNGNAGSSNSHYAEGQSIPYRVLLTGLTAGKTYSIILGYDTKHSDRMAIDYLTHYQRLLPHGPFGHDPEVVNPLRMQSGSNEYNMTVGAPVTRTFPAPDPTPGGYWNNSDNGSHSGDDDGTPVDNQPLTSFTNLDGGDPTKKVMTLWNGSFIAMNYVVQESLTGASAQAETQIRIKFMASSDSALFAWGGHIGSRLDWLLDANGVPRSAGGISGSPYHMRLKQLFVFNSAPVGTKICNKDSCEVGLGNQDRSLSAQAVIPPPVCPTVDSKTQCMSSTSFTFDVNSPDGETTYTWSLGSNTVDAAISGSAEGSSVTIIHNGGGVFTNSGSFTLNISAEKNGATLECPAVATGTVVKVAVGASASPTSLDLAVSNTSQLNTVLTGSDDTNFGNYTYSWAQAPAAGGSLSASNIRNPVFTATAPGSYTFTVTATQTAAPFCSDTGIVIVNVGGSAPPCTVFGPSPICPGSTNSYVYDPTGDGAADPIPTNYTAVWTLENNTNLASKVGPAPHTGNSVSVTAGATCATSFRIRITLTSTSGLLTSTCFKDVTVNDVIPPTITSCPADVVIECDASSLPANTGTATADDNCSAAVTYSDVVTPGCYTIITRTWKATDPCGNSSTCTQRIIKRDRTAPVITCPTSGPATATDNCSTTITIFSRDAGTTRTWTAVDESGNISTCNQTISALQAPTEKKAPVVVEQALKTATTTSTSKLVTKPVQVPDSESGLTVQAFPNPYTDEVNFRIVSPVSGKALLEVYDMVGRKMAVVYQGNISANNQKAIKYNVPALSKTPMIFKLSVGNLKTRGSLIPTKD